MWVSLLAPLMKRRIGFSIQRLMGVDVSSFMVTKNTQSRFYPSMESIFNDAYSELKRTWIWVVNNLSGYAKRAHPASDRKTGRLKYGLVSVNL